MRELIARTVYIAIMVMSSVAIVASPTLEAQADTGRIGVVVSIPPLAQFVGNVGGERVKVTVLLPPGKEPHTFSPTPRDLKKAKEAFLFVVNGAKLEFWMDRVTEVNPDIIVVDTSQGVELIDDDPHIWLSPRNARLQVKNILEALIKLDPEYQDYYKHNASRYLQKLDGLDRSIEISLEGIKVKKFIIFHPAFTYFARDYNLEQITVEVGGKSPKAKDIKRAIDEALKHNIKVIIASPQFDSHSAEVIASEIEGEVVFIDPLAQNYLQNMYTILGILVDIMD
jgi:zinc transport system substrate-binding protein